MIPNDDCENLHYLDTWYGKDSLRFEEDHSHVNRKTMSSIPQVSIRYISMSLHPCYLTLVPGYAEFT